MAAAATGGGGPLEEVRAEDFVEYFLFPDNSANIENILKELNEKVKIYCENYIWHRDPFHLRIGKISRENDLPSHLYGVTHFGDNIEDEWFIVSLLVYLTRQVPGLVVRVIDSDGEFLLIEAAEYLPKWAGPETCANRVYLYGGSVHLVSDENNEKDINISACISRIRNKNDNTKATDEIQAAVQARVQGYPSKIKESLHYCNVYVPITVAALLKARPQLVAPAVLAFCDRDMIDIKACRAMRFFPPETRVLTRVAFTKCLYAALIRQRFVPDKCTGWLLPNPTSQDFPSHELGAKLASGFEILVARAKPKDIDNSRAWQMYIDKLKSRGYFQGLLEGSKDHKTKMTEAKEFFNEHGPNAGEAVGESILALLTTLDIDEEAIQAQSANLPPSDSDKWLEVTAEELDNLLHSRYGSPRKVNQKKSDANDIPATLNKFLGHVSGLEGAEFPGESPPSRPKRGIKKPKATTQSQLSEDNLSSSPNLGKINFNPEAFTCAVQNILDFSIPNDNWDLESNSDMSSLDEDFENTEELNKVDKSKIDSKMKEYMRQMDQELAGTTMAQSFEKPASNQVDDSFDDIEDFQPVDINLTALKNVLASYEAELGVAPGPASTLLGPMGVHLEKISEPKDDNSGK